MIEIKFVFSDIKDFINLATTDKMRGKIFISNVDEKTRKGKKEAYALKSEWGAKESPFALILEGDKVIKAFYAEAEDVVNSIIKFVNDYESKCN